MTSEEIRARIEAFEESERTAESPSELRQARDAIEFLRGVELPRAEKREAAAERERALAVWAEKRAAARDASEAHTCAAEGLHAGVLALGAGIDEFDRRRGELIRARAEAQGAAVRAGLDRAEILAALPAEDVRWEGIEERATRWLPRAIASVRDAVQERRNWGM